MAGSIGQPTVHGTVIVRGMMGLLKSWSAWLAAPFVLALLSGCGPTLLLPGGELSGPVEPIPADWAFAEAVSTVQLETKPAEPYSVNIWAVGIGNRLYVHAGTNRSQWVENLIADPQVRVRIEGKIYPLVASRVERPEEFADFADAYKKKYGVRPRNENVADVYLYRLDARL